MIKPLTSIRFFFAFMVFLSHFSIQGKALFEGGHIGVSFFFILSGFILSYSYKNKIISGFCSKRNFWIARIARIFPLHLVTLLAAVIVSVVLVKYGGDYPSPNWGALPLNLTLTQALVPVDSVYFSFNAVSWSISDEAFFYLMFPFIILVLNKVKWYIKSFIALSFFTAYTVMLNVVPQNMEVALFYINPLVRIVDFIIGIILFYLWERFYPTLSSHRGFEFVNNHKIMTVLESFSILLMAIFIYFSDSVGLVYTYGLYFWLPMVVIIFIFSQPNNVGFFARIFSFKPLIFLGEISFGFYMIHQLAIGVVMRAFNIAGLSQMAWQIKVVIVFLIIVGLSVISFMYFETPCNKWIKNKFKLRNKS